MNYRLNGTTIALVTLLVLIAAGLFVYTLISAPTSEEVTEEEMQAVPAPETMEQIISAKHQYREGVHTIAGMAQVPTSCHGIVIEPFFVDGAATTTVELRFTTVLEGEECPAVPSDAPFMVSFEAPEDVRVEVVWDGTPVRLNLMPVGPDESLGEEFYFKG
jgi:hypothetical protein